MHPSERQRAILQMVALNGSATVASLSQQFGVSGETVRRDLRRLEGDGLVRKVHGGVQLPEQLEEPVFEQRLQHQAQAKQAIARRAASLVQDGDSLILDTGSTTAYVARALRDHRNLLVVTNSVDIARCLAMRNGNRVFLAGGELRSEDGAATGQEAIEFLRRFWVQKAFLAVGAVDAEMELMEYTLAEAEMSRIIVSQSKTRILVADASKFGRRAPIRDVALSDIDMLITDRLPPPELAAALDAANVETLIADIH